MKVFLSYGHDANTPLVERIRADLAAAGHDPWIDTAEIKAGQDWRRRIAEGIKSSDWTLAFLSKHSTRDPGVCLDEMAIALHEKAGAIATILVEPSAQVRPPVTLRQIQHLDMHDWAARQAADSQAFEAWYKTKIAEILAVLASPATLRFSGEIDELARRLRPIAQEADIAPLIEGFVGRAWLMDRLEAWRIGNTAARIFWLTGAPGSGKSAFSARAAHWGRSNVISLSLCRYNVDDRRDAARIVRTLAFQIATRLEDYRLLLLDRLRLHDPEGADLARKSAPDLFDALLIQPLRHGIDGGRSRDRLLVVVDALDETVRDGRSPLAEVLAEGAPRLPEWIALLVTSRPDSPIARQFAGITPQPIGAEGTENRADLEAYAKGWLATQPNADALVHSACAAANGNFLYLRKLREGFDAGWLDLTAPEGLPKGLIGLYERWFRHLFPDPAAYERDTLPAIQVIVAAENPVPEPVLTALFHWSVRDRARQLERLGGLFERRPEGVAPFHKSLRDWLIDEHAAGADFVADAAAGRRLLLEFLWSRFLDLARAKAHAMPDAFLLAELPHLVASAQGQAIVASMPALPEWERALQHAILSAERSGKQFAWVSAASWLDMAFTLTADLGDQGLPYRRHILNAQGDLARAHGNQAERLRLYQAALAVAEKMVVWQPDELHWRHDLYGSHAQVGDALRALGDRDGALQAYQASLPLAESLAAKDPANTRWQRNLTLIGHMKVGVILLEKGDAAGALQSFQSNRAVLERLAAQEPGDAQWQTELADAHAMIGKALMAQENPVDAANAFRTALAIEESLAAPATPKLQSDIAANYSHLGYTLSMQNDPAAALAAYRTSLEIRERLAALDPANPAWQRNLSITYSRVGSLMQTLGDPAGALHMHRADAAIAAPLAARDPANAEWQRDLVVSHYKQTTALLALNDPAAHDQALLTQRLTQEWAQRFPNHPTLKSDLESVEDLIQRSAPPTAFPPP